MFKKIRILIGLVIALTATSTALAQGPAPQHSAAFWDGEFWNNMSLSGEPIVTEAHVSIDWAWGRGSPHASIDADHFSARWTRYIDLEAGTYRFTATSDDGIRVFVDGRLIIDEWNDHPARTYNADITLAGGHHEVVVEYYENEGLATAKLSWSLLSSTIRFWRAEYFDNASLSGAPVLVRDDEAIDFNWGNGSPYLGLIGADEFSIRWTQTLDLPAGHYRFAMTVDDGGRLWVNNHLLIDSWRDQPARTYTGDIYVSGGPVPIKMEYYENSGYATARLLWTQTQAPPSAGTVVVDNTDPGFVSGGSARGWHTAYEGYDGSLIWTRNNDSARGNYNWARWIPSLQAGRYEVFVFIPERYSTTANARYWIAHRDGYALRIVDQSSNGDRWVSLGTYWFDSEGDEYVSLSDITNEPYVSRLIAFDAVKWVPR